jgi:S-layer protein (TIGR01567 family)
LYVTNYIDNTVTAVNTTTNKIIASIKVGDGPEGIAVHPDGTTVYVTNNFGRSVSVIDTTTNFVVTNVIVGAFPRGVAVSQDGNYIYVANQEDNTLSIINTVTFQQIKVKVGIKPNGVAVDPNGRYIYVVNQKSENVSWVGTYSYTAIYDWPAKKSPMAMGQFIVPPENIFTNSKVISTPYYYQSWGNYPLINIFDKKYIPLLSNGDPIWKNHVDKIAMLLNDSRGPYTLNVGKKAKELDLGQGYSLIAKAVDVDSKKVWLEFDKDGHYVDDAFISTDTGDHTWTCKLDNLQGVENVPVLKVHVNKINNYSTNGTQINTVNIDGLWLIDYANTRTLNIDDSFGNTPFIKYTLTKTINGNPFYYDSNQPFCGELVFKRSSFMITLSDQNKTKVK